MCSTFNVCLENWGDTQSCHLLPQMNKNFETKHLLHVNDSNNKWETIQYPPWNLVQHVHS